MSSCTPGSPHHSRLGPGSAYIEGIVSFRVAKQQARGPRQWGGAAAGRLPLCSEPRADPEGRPRVQVLLEVPALRDVPVQVEAEEAHGDAPTIGRDAVLQA